MNVQQANENLLMLCRDCRDTSKAERDAARLALEQAIEEESVSKYTDAVVQDSWGSENVRHVVFPSGRLHVATQPEATNRLGFTICGRVIPQRALVDTEIPERFRPKMCRQCEDIGLSEQR